MTSDAHGDRMLPADLNDMRAWLELELEEIDEYLGELEARAAELSPSTFRELMRNEIVAEDDIYFWGTRLVQATDDPLRKLQVMQAILFNVDIWPGWESAANNVEFLEFLWQIGTVAKELQSDPEVLSSVLEQLLDDPEIWWFPLAPTAIIAAHPVREQDVRMILGKFINAWDLSQDEPEFIGSDDIDDELEDGDTELSAPLIAVCVLNPSAPMDLVDAVLKIATFGNSEKFPLAFWEYVSACLTDDRVYTGYWDPVEVWRAGFFGNGLDKDAPPIDPSRALHILKHFKKHATHLDLANPYGEQTLAPQVMTFLASRPDVDPETLTDIAMNCRWVDPVRAAIQNPITPDEAKAAGALRIP